jgi:hypothetical protein
MPIEFSNKMNFYYACRGHGSGFAAAAIFGANTPLFGTTDAFGAAEVATGIRGASACCRWAGL